MFIMGKRYSFKLEDMTVTGRVEAVYVDAAYNVADVRVRGYGWLDLNVWAFA